MKIASRTSVKYLVVGPSVILGPQFEAVDFATRNGTESRLRELSAVSECFARIVSGNRVRRSTLNCYIRSVSVVPSARRKAITSCYSVSTTHSREEKSTDRGTSSTRSVQNFERFSVKQSADRPVFLSVVLLNRPVFHEISVKEMITTQRCRSEGDRDLGKTRRRDTFSLLEVCHRIGTKASRDKLMQMKSQVYSLRYLATGFACVPSEVITERKINRSSVWSNLHSIRRSRTTIVAVAPHTEL